MRQATQQKKISKAEIFQFVCGTLWNLAPGFIAKRQELTQLVQAISRDLEAYVLKDPSARGNSRLVFNEYCSFRAVAFYRIAHCILNSVYSGCSGEHLESVARRISEAAKAMSGIEIHPRAQLGHSLVIDHGAGTVIGETAIVGNNVTMLHNVLLGARKVAKNPLGKRHPTVGNNVEIGGNVSVLGPVTIGENCFLGAGVTITHDVAPNSKVVLECSVQITKQRYNNGD